MACCTVNNERAPAVIASASGPQVEIEAELIKSCAQLPAGSFKLKLIMCKEGEGMELGLGYSSCGRAAALRKWDQPTHTRASRERIILASSLFALPRTHIIYTRTQRRPPTDHPRFQHTRWSAFLNTVCVWERKRDSLTQRTKRAQI